MRVAAVKEATLVEAAIALKQLVVDAVRREDLTKEQAQPAFAGISTAIRALEGTLNPYWAQKRELPPYTDWPNDRQPCPKCGDTKPRFRKWRRATSHAPERVEHVCYCDFSLFTKPLDETEEIE